MGSKPSRIAVKTLKILESCSNLLKKHESTLDSHIITTLLNNAPLSAKALKDLLSTSLENSIIKLKRKLFKTYPKSTYAIYSYITLHITHSKSKEPFYTYINSMRSLLYLHKTKIKTLLSYFIKQKSPTQKIFQIFLTQIKGSLAFPGLCELEELVSSHDPNISILLKVFKQTKKSQKKIEFELEDCLKSSTPTNPPKNFEFIRENLQKSLKTLDFPILSTNNLL